MHAYAAQSCLISSSSIKVLETLRGMRQAYTYQQENIGAVTTACPPTLGYLLCLSPTSVRLVVR